ncbi:MAG: tetratricopeptide repeat protein [Gammaproteobacteria bacterium]|nr:tetratricopeptide repeat protein [Gammaproteobacteria bacterium]
MSLINQMLSDLDTRQSAQEPADIPLPGLHKAHNKPKPLFNINLVVAGTVIFIVTFISIYFWMETEATVQKTTITKPVLQTPPPVPKPALSVVKPVPEIPDPPSPSIPAVNNIETIAVIKPVPMPEPKIKTVITPIVKAIKPKKIIPIITPSTLIADANNYVDKGDYNQAINTLSRYLEDNPAQHDVRATLVSIYTQRGDYPKAQSVLLNAIKKWPQHHHYEMMMARLLLEQQQDQDALHILQASTNNSAGYHAFIAAIYQRLSQHRMAIQHYNVALQSMPDNGLWWLGLGISQEQQGQRQKALAAFNHASNTNNISPRILQYIDQRIAALQPIDQDIH